MISILQRVAVSGAFFGISSAALAQAPDLAQAQRQFDAQVAKCNSGALPRPERDACIRDAGAALDRARGGPAGNVTTRTRDRRSTVVKPEGAPVPGSTATVRSGDRRSTVVTPQGTPAPAGTTTVTTPDGRSTVVVPAPPQR
ncbi:hypothetical protein VAR608DRAFT_5339 [Variovorax sp. HW608]|uniref:hypothetical protein n=1 Tax=Variovorax sp. HW608 TaxID=1034889 RepID=UPI0008201CFA|nr:hypothetical protein [Variovorax sp. HW608]SCK52744.1 hypothetical protein VAR608DRAFT_5339 [Variovorax sp. HW608]